MSNEMLLRNQNHTIVFYNDDEINHLIERLYYPYAINQIPIFSVLNNRIHNRIKQSMDKFLVNSIEFYDSNEIYYENNVFDLDRVISKATQLLQQLPEDRPAVIMGEMPIDQMDQNEHQLILQYEEIVSEMYSDDQTIVYCFYNIDKLDNNLTTHLKTVHPFNFEDGNLHTLQGQIISQESSFFSTQCMRCHKTKNSANEWSYVEATGIPLSTNRVSHGLCDICLQNFP